MVQQNPALLQPFLQQLGASNPELLQVINRNQAAFIRHLEEGTGLEFEHDDDGEDLGDFGEGDMEGGEGGQQIAVTEEEKAAIERLSGMGFDPAVVIQAYFACDKDEALAANYLMDHGFDDDF